jgi:hypothetical protein
MDVVTGNRPPAMRHVHLEITRWRVIPVLESPHGDALAKRRVHACSAPAPAEQHRVSDEAADQWWQRSSRAVDREFRAGGRGVRGVPWRL